ncbi:citrate (pro-3S)-lyase subunit beta [Pseudomonas matsuisoli]|uniref:Citrate (Pro-3S)-lyase subunit beta n=2 Tax=Pseudomonas matsuisoli TaxID=1515666 RepID=A0A917UVL2_9PSED|nr:citrate (pro-3S)-lyase subunit beta [Pseudomonas matsuisoli]
MRSKLFVPGSRPELFDKAMNSAADGVSFDLEDAVAPERKAQARSQLADYLFGLKPTAKKIVVRINEISSRFYADDLQALVGSQMRIVNLPKVESPEQITELVNDLERLEGKQGLSSPLHILANIESPCGLRRAFDIAAAHPRVMGLQLGFADLLEPLGIDRYDAGTVRQLQLALRLAAGEAGVAAYDTAYAQIKDPEGFAGEAAAARRLGFAGKSCIHPSQIELANAAFLPSADDITRALAILEAEETAQASGVGAYQMDGQMIDAPFVRRARVIVEQARHAGLLNPL